MANLTAVFELVDRISSKLDAIATRGTSVVDSWENVGNTIDQSFDSAISAADSATEAVSSYSQSAAEAATSTDFWTDAVGNYDRSALEAVYSTEELVDMGMKSADALEYEADIMAQCDKAAQELTSAIEDAAKVQDDCSAAMERASSVAEEVAENDKVSAQTKEALQQATENATAAIEELTAAQNEAQAAMENYDAVMSSGTASLEEMQAAAERASQASDKLVSANERATKATDDLSQAADNAAEEAENSGKSGIGAVEGVASALAAAGITATVKEIASAAYDLADAYSEASKIVVNATGATGDALDGLNQSMMTAFAGNDDSLEDTAAAVGEINTRLGLTGDELTDVTGKFMDFADVTGGNAAKSVRSITQLMSQWKIPASDMDLLLDKMTYAGQASGISVDTLTSQLISNKAILDQLGFSLDEATAMFMKFELAGTNTTAVMTGFRTALSSGAISSLEELYAVFDEISSGAMSAADASEMFGSRAGPAIVDAVNSGVLSLDDMIAALEASGGTMEKTAEAGESLSEKWEKANNSMSTAFTTAVQPAIDGVSSAFAGLLNGVGEFLNEHPTVTKAITAVAVGVGVVVAGIAGVTFVSTVAIPAITAFGVALNTALGPIGWVALAITGIVAAGAALVAMLGNAEDETAGMTAVTRQQYYELQDLNAEYERACEAYGENSEEALRLKYQVDDLSEAFENSRQTLEEFQAEVDELCNSVYELSDGFNSAISEINSNETSTLALIQKYQDLSEKATLTAGEQKQLEAVTKSLSEAFPDLAAKIDSATISTEDYVAAMKKSAEQEAEARRQEEAQEAYIEALKKRAELTEELEKAQANYNAELEAHDMVWNETLQQYENYWYTADSLWASWTTDIDDYKSALDTVNAAMDENEALIAQIEHGWEVTAEAEKEAAQATVSYKDAVSTALDSVQEEITELCEAYDKAYESARSSIDGQIGLFDTMKTETELSVQDMQTALASQLEYLQTYTENLKLAAEYGIDEGLIASLSDGSAESAGYVNAIVENIKQLGEGSEEAQAFVDSFNTSFQEVEAAKDEFATTVATMETDFDTKMGEIESRLEESIDNMNMEADAAAAAKSTMAAYTQSIIDGTANAVSAAESAAAAVAAALSTTQVTAGSNKVPGHAKGTTNAEDVFIAGEEGPELIVGAGGSTVFPHSETEQIISALNKPQEAVTVVNQYSEPTGFVDKLESVFVKMFGKLAGVFDRIARTQPETVELEAYATGTTQSEDTFIAGENGPELIIGKQDSTVFPAKETDRIVEAVSALYDKPVSESVEHNTVYGDEVTNQYEAAYDYSRAVSQTFGDTIDSRSYATENRYDISRFIDQSVGDTVDKRAYSFDYSTTIDNSTGDSTEIVGAGGSTEIPALFVPVNENSVISDDGTSEDNASTRKILLEIAGKGNIQLTGGKVDKETLLSFLYEYLKPVLAEILSQEIYEEGDIAYEY